MANVKFKISMDNEAKKSGDVHEVNVTVNMNVETSVLEEWALKAYVVAIQSQIRPNWAAFIKGDYTKELALGQPMFGKRAKATPEQAKTLYKNSINALSPKEKLEKLLEDGLISEEMFDTLYEQLEQVEELEEEQLEDQDQ